MDHLSNAFERRVRPRLISRPIVDVEHLNVPWQALTEFIADLKELVPIKCQALGINENRWFMWYDCELNMVNFQIGAVYRDNEERVDETYSFKVIERQVDFDDEGQRAKYKVSGFDTRSPSNHRDYMEFVEGMGERAGVRVGSDDALEMDVNMDYGSDIHGVRNMISIRYYYDGMAVVDGMKCGLPSDIVYNFEGIHDEIKRILLSKKTNDFFDNSGAFRLLVNFMLNDSGEMVRIPKWKGRGVFYCHVKYEHENVLCVDVVDNDHSMYRDVDFTTSSLDIVFDPRLFPGTLNIVSIHENVRTVSGMGLNIHTDDSGRNLRADSLEAKVFNTRGNYYEILKDLVYSFISNRGYAGHRDGFHPLFVEFFPWDALILYLNHVDYGQMENRLLFNEYDILENGQREYISIYERGYPRLKFLDDNFQFSPGIDEGGLTAQFLDMIGVNLFKDDVDPYFTRPIKMLVLGENEYLPVFSKHTNDKSDIPNDIVKSMNLDVKLNICKRFVQLFETCIRSRIALGRVFSSSFFKIWEICSELAEVSRPMADYTLKHTKEILKMNLPNSDPRMASIGDLNVFDEREEEYNAVLHETIKELKVNNAHIKLSKFWKLHMITAKSRFPAFGHTNATNEFATKWTENDEDKDIVEDYIVKFCKDIYPSLDLYGYGNDEELLFDDDGNPNVFHRLITRIRSRKTTDDGEPVYEFTKDDKDFIHNMFYDKYSNVRTGIPQSNFPPKRACDRLSVIIADEILRPFYDPIIEFCCYMNAGVDSVFHDYEIDFFDIERRVNILAQFYNPTTLDVRVQGQPLNKKSICDRIHIRTTENENTEILREKVQLLKNIIMSSDDGWLEKFLKAVTGSRTMNGRTRIYVHGTTSNGFVVAHTCSQTIDMNHLTHDFNGHDSRLMDKQTLLLRNIEEGLFTVDGAFDIA